MVSLQQPSSALFQDAKNVAVHGSQFNTAARDHINITIINIQNGMAWFILSLTWNSFRFRNRKRWWIPGPGTKHPANFNESSAWPSALFQIKDLLTCNGSRINRPRMNGQSLIQSRCLLEKEVLYPLDQWVWHQCKKCQKFYSPLGLDFSRVSRN